MTKMKKATATRATKQRAHKTAPKPGTRRQVNGAPTAREAPEKSGAASVPIRQSKKSAIIALLGRPGGAAISDLTVATGWQVHSVRAALTGLRNDGKELARSKDDAGVTRYRLGADA